MMKNYKLHCKEGLGDAKVKQYYKEGKLWRCHIRFGLASDIPLCCVLEWCFRRLVLRQGEVARKVGCYRNNGCHNDFVHCWFHRRDHVLSIVPYDHSYSSGRVLPPL